MQICSCRRGHSSPEGRIPCRLLCTGHSYTEGVPADTIFFYGECYLPEINAGYDRKGETDHGDVMKNEETGRISYYTSKKEVVYTSLMMCENPPQE